MSVLGICMALVVVAASAYYFFFCNTEKNDKKEQSPVTSKDPAVATPVNDDANKEKAEVKPVVKDQKKSKAASKSNKKPQKAVVVRDPRFLRRFAGHHSESILNMSVSPNGEWLATCGLDGKVRVTSTNINVQQPITLSTNVNDNLTNNTYGKNCVGHIAWSPDNRTLVGTVVNSGEMAFFRMRKKKEVATDAAAAAKASKNPFELIELTKRRFATTNNSKSVTDINSCVVDHMHSHFMLVLTSCDDPSSSTNVTVGWDGDNGTSLGSANLGNVIASSGHIPSDIRISPDGRFLCRGNFSPQVKLFEVQKKKQKGEINPVFDRISPKGVMTLVVGHPVADVCYFSTDNISATSAATGTNMMYAVVGCADGWIQVWDLNVEYKLREDPKRVCEFQIDLLDDAEVGDDEILTHVAASSCRASASASASTSHQKIAVATSKGRLLLLTYHTNANTASSSSLVLDATIDKIHDEPQQRRAADLQFGNPGDVVYTRADNSKDVFAWRV